jgi:hypothetical protein
MAEGIGIINGFIELIKSIIGLESESKKVKRQTILEMYPSLISDLKMGLNQFKNEFLVGRYQGGFFPKLHALDHSSELRRIRPINNKLYDDLKKVIQEITPAMVELDKVRIENRKKVEQSWGSYVNQLREDSVIFLRQRNVSPLVSDLSNRFYWELCAHNMEEAESIYNEWKNSRDSYFDTWGAKNAIPNDFLNSFVEIFNSHWEDLEQLYYELLEKYENFIQVRLINKMSTALEI